MLDNYRSVTNPYVVEFKQNKTLSEPSVLGLIFDLQEMERTLMLAKESIESLKEENRDLTEQVERLQEQIVVPIKERTLLEALAKALRPYLDIPDDGWEDC